MWSVSGANDIGNFRWEFICGAGTGLFCLHLIGVNGPPPGGATLSDLRCIHGVHLGLLTIGPFSDCLKASEACDPFHWTASGTVVQIYGHACDVGTFTVDIVPCTTCGISSGSCYPPPDDTTLPNQWTYSCCPNRTEFV